jgi:hypothetical protein
MQTDDWGAFVGSGGTHYGPGNGNLYPACKIAGFNLPAGVSPPPADCAGMIAAPQ